MEKGLTLEQAYRIMGGLIIGINNIDRFLGFIPKNLHLISLTEMELEAHAKKGHRLYLEIPHTFNPIFQNDSQPLNIEMLAKIACRKKGNRIGPNEYLFWPQQFNDEGSVKSEAWFYNDPLVMNATPGFGWKIASEEVIPETLGLDYIDQADALIDYHRKLYKKHLLEHYKQAISEWEAKRSILKEILYTNKAAEQIAKCKVTSLIRESFVSTEYRRLLIHETEGRKILQNNWSWSNTRSLDGEFVIVGAFDDDGAAVSSDAPDYRDGSIGVSFSHSV